MQPPHYVIRGGAQGRERLRLLSRVMAPGTVALLDRIGVPRDARCLDLGCGGGDVTLALAARAPDGHVTGLDMDGTVVALARDEAAQAGFDNVEFLVGDVAEAALADEAYDVVTARFLLTHLPDPAATVRLIRRSLAPGGVAAVEDIDFAGQFCHPPNPAFDRYLELYDATVRARGADPDIGRRLPSLLFAAGFVDLTMHVVHAAGFEGDVKLVAPLTLENIADAVAAEGLASTDELEQLVRDLYAFAEAEGTVMSAARVVQVSGRRPIA